MLPLLGGCQADHPHLSRTTPTSRQSSASPAPTSSRAWSRMQRPRAPSCCRSSGGRATSSGPCSSTTSPPCAPPQQAMAYSPTSASGKLLLCTLCRHTLQSRSGDRLNSLASCVPLAARRGGAASLAALHAGAGRAAAAPGGSQAVPCAGHEAGMGGALRSGGASHQDQDGRRGHRAL